MKSTIKIDYDRTKNLSPVIKIIIPKSAGHSEAAQLLSPTPGFLETTDEDVKDKLLRDFLQLPCMAVPNSFFEVKTHFPIQDDLELTTIGPIEEDNLFSRFRWALIHRLVPSQSINILCARRDANNPVQVSDLAGSHSYECGEDSWNKINEFFNWVDKQEYAPTERD